MGHQLKQALGLVPADSATAIFGPSPARRLLRPEGTSTSKGSILGSGRQKIILKSVVAGTPISQNMFKSISQPCLPYFIFLTIINGLEDKLPFLLNKSDGGGFRAEDILEAAERPLGAMNSVLTGIHSKLLTDRTRPV